MEVRVELSMAVALSPGNVLDLALPGFLDTFLEFATEGEGGMPPLAAPRQMEVYHNWTSVCETVCNMSCVPANGSNDGSNETVCAPTLCSEECVAVGKPQTLNPTP